MKHMSNVEIIDAKGAKGDSVELPDEIFDVEVASQIPLVHQVVNAQLAAARQGTHATKTRARVAGGGRKPYRQKGTGRARQGSIRAPQFTGGGIVHGPQPRDYSQRTPKKFKAAALRVALSDRAQHNRVHIVESFVSGDTPSTKAAKEALQRVVENRSALVVVESETDELQILSLKNLQEVLLTEWHQLNTYDVLLMDDVVFTKAAYDAFIEARLKREAK